jgi:hypothetical protein
MWWFMFIKPMIMSIVNKIIRAFKPRKKRRKDEDD